MSVFCSCSSTESIRAIASCSSALITTDLLLLPLALIDLDHLWMPEPLLRWGVVIGLAVTAVQLAETLGAKGIIVITRRGLMADYVTNCHPQKTRIFAFTNDSQTRRRLILNRNLTPYRTAFSSDPEKTLQTSFDVLKERAGLQSNDKVVVISDVLAGTGIEAIQIRHLP